MTSNIVHLLKPYSNNITKCTVKTPIENNGTLYPLEMKKHANPQKKDISAFVLLDKIPNINAVPVVWFICIISVINTVTLNVVTLRRVDAVAFQINFLMKNRFKNVGDSRVQFFIFVVCDLQQILRMNATCYISNTQYIIMRKPTAE